MKKEHMAGKMKKEKDPYAKGMKTLAKIKPTIGLGYM